LHMNKAAEWFLDE